VSEQFIIPKGGMEFRLRQIAQFLASLSKGRAWRVTVEEMRLSRSVQQCRYLNGVAYKAIGDATGYERDDISEWCNGQFFGWKEKRVPKTKWNPAGIEHVPLRTTTTDETGKRAVLSKMEFVDYVDWVIRFAASKGIHIPEPNEEFDEGLEDVA